jgi:hypothetical protein
MNIPTTASQTNTYLLIGTQTMGRVRITGWRAGLKKVSMTKAIRLHGGLNLALAKNCTDSVLDGKTVVVDVPTLNDAHVLVDELIALGAVAEVEGSPPM